MIKTGDIVRIKQDLTCRLYRGWGVSPEMTGYAGKSAVVMNVGKDTCGMPTYTLNIDDGLFVWTAGMFEPTEDEDHYALIEKIAAEDLWARKKVEMVMPDPVNPISDEERESLMDRCKNVLGGAI